MTSGAISRTIARMPTSHQTSAAAQIDAASLDQARAPGVIRRLLSAIYDLLLLTGVLVVASAVVTLPYQAWLGGDLTRGLPRLLFQLYLLMICALYYLYFWSGARQTLGMRAWRLQLVRMDGQVLSWTDALRRLGLTLLCMAPLGLGLWWVWLDQNRLSWHDRLSGTRLVLLAKPNRRRSRS